ncbi:MAG TPA: SLC13 family permease, partial [Ktedonobacteraceae bacterium]
MFLFFPIPGVTRTLLILLIAIFTLVGIMVRPWKMNEALTALAGAGLLILLGLIPPAQVFFTLAQDWNTFFFFLGMMGLSALAETAGFFDWLAAWTVSHSGSSARRLFLNTFLLGSLISMFFSNDATALILTPIVYSITTRLRLPVLPYLFACTFIADSASFLLPVSNPINIIVLSTFPLDLWTFLRLLFIPCLVVIGINMGVFMLLYRRHLHGRFDSKLLPSITESIPHQGYFRYTCLVLLLVAISYVTAAALRVPLSLIALTGALLLFIGARYWKRSTIVATGKQISWSIFVFIAGMFVIVRAVENTNLTTLFGQALLHLSGGSSFGAVMIGTLGAALGTNLINNVPMAVVLTSSLHSLQHAPLAVQHGFIAATIFGCDLGPNVTTVGSLATVLWLLILRRRNLDVSGLDYFKVGIVVTPLMLLAGAVTIWL